VSLLFAAIVLAPLALLAPPDRELARSR
jgi:hypothetical protein